MWDNIVSDTVEGEQAYGDEVGEEDGTEKFIMKNGCCRECMKAFSKTGKVILFHLK